MHGKFKTRLDAFWHSYIPQFFFLKILFLVPKVSNSWIFQRRFFIKIIWHRISIQTLLFHARLPPRQNGVENRDKAYCIHSRLLSFLDIESQSCTEAGSRISQRELTTSFRTCEVFVNMRDITFFLNECFLAFESHLSYTIKIYGKIGSVFL